MDYAIFDEVSVVAGCEPGEVFGAHLDHVALAEELGFHSYWFAEHHFSHHRLAPSPNLLIAAAARETSTIRLGNMVNVLPFHHPVRLAEECAMLDHLTHGRLLMGVGRGVQPPEFQRLHLDMSASRQMFFESIDMMQQLWTQEGATRKGDFWSYEDVTLSPGVRQRPYPPIWFTGLSQESMEWAADQGLPFATAFSPPDRVEELGAEYKKRFRPTQQNPAPLFICLRHVYVSDSLETARDEVGDTYDRLFHSFLDIALTSQTAVPDSYRKYPGMHSRLGSMKLDDLLESKIILFGSPDDVAKDVSDLERRGVDMLLVWVSPEDVLPDQAQRCMRRFKEEVMPRVTLSAPDGTVIPAT